MGRSTASYRKTTRNYKNSTLIYDVKHRNLTASEPFTTEKNAKIKIPSQSREDQRENAPEHLSLHSQE